MIRALSRTVAPRPRWFLRAARRADGISCRSAVTALLLAAIALGLALPRAARRAPAAPADEKPVIAVLRFRVHSSKPLDYLGESLANLVRTRLEASGEVRVLGAERHPRRAGGDGGSPGGRRRAAPARRRRRRGLHRHRQRHRARRPLQPRRAGDPRGGRAARPHAGAHGGARRGAARARQRSVGWPARPDRRRRAGRGREGRADRRRVRRSRAARGPGDARGRALRPGDRARGPREAAPERGDRNRLGRDRAGAGGGDRPFQDRARGPAARRRGRAGGEPIASRR